MSGAEKARDAAAVALIHPDQLAAFDRAWRTAIDMLGHLAEGAHDEQALPLCAVFGALTTLGAIVSENTTTIEHAGRDLEALGSSSANGGAS